MLYYVDYNYIMFNNSLNGDSGMCDTYVETWQSQMFNQHLRNSARGPSQ